MRAIAAPAVMFCLASVAAAQQLNSTPDRLTHIRHPETMPPVSKYEYGMFTEHIRDSMYRAVWTEMLDDRKFYFPITSTPDPAPRPQQGGGGGPRAAARRPWRPVGADGAVTMDKQHPFVLDGAQRRTRRDLARGSLSALRDAARGSRQSQHRSARIRRALFQDAADLRSGKLLPRRLSGAGKRISHPVGQGLGRAGRAIMRPWRGPPSSPWCRMTPMRRKRNFAGLAHAR